MGLYKVAYALYDFLVRFCSNQVYLLQGSAVFVKVAVCINKTGEDGFTFCIQHLFGLVLCENKIILPYGENPSVFNGKTFSCSKMIIHCIYHRVVNNQVGLDFGFLQAGGT